MTTSTKPTKKSGRKRKGGRPTLPQARRRSKSVTVKFSKIDYETLRIRSRKANRRLAEYIRNGTTDGATCTTYNGGCWRVP